MTSHSLIAYEGRTIAALCFLAFVLLLVLSQLALAWFKGVLYAPGKRAILRVERAREPVSFWGAIVFYGVVVVVVGMMANGLLDELIHPGAPEPTRLTAVALTSSNVELSWFSPERRTPPPSYGIYRATAPGASLDDYELIATVTNQPYNDLAVEPSTRYYYRVASNYEGEPPAMSNEDSTVTGPPE